MNLNDLLVGFEEGGVPKELAAALLTEYASAKRRFYLGDHRPTAVDGGRFTEAVMRVVDHGLFGEYTPLSKSPPKLSANRLAELESATSPQESLKIHIPRALYAVYSVRNKRNAAHLNDGIDPNLQDATLVIEVLDWVLAELVRIYHRVSAEDAQAVIADLVTREVPVIEEIDGQPVCSKELGVSDRVLVFLYRSGRDLGLDPPELQRQLRHPNRGNLMRSVRGLDGKGLVLEHPVSGRIHITSKGLADVDRRRLLYPA